VHFTGKKVCLVHKSREIFVLFEILSIPTKSRAVMRATRFIFILPAFLLISSTLWTDVSYSHDQNISNDFHKTHVKKIVGFRSPQVVGRENPDEVIHTFEAGQPVYLTGYFHTDMKSKGGVPTFKIIHHDDLSREHAENKHVQITQKEYFQPMYVPEDKKTQIELQETFQYALFPEISKLDYDSHLEYIPHLNFARWVLTLLPGVYDLEFVFGIRNELARSSFKMTVTADSRRKVREYYDALMAKKIDAVTFPMISCQNKAGSIPNVSELSRFGKLIKVDYAQSDDIMFPWPRNNEVQFNTARGYGVFENKGKLEVIYLEFRKVPSASQFDFYSLGEVPQHLAMICPNQNLIKPDILEYGYEMRKENLYKCHPW